VGWSPCDSLSSLADPGTTSEPYQNPGDRVPGFLTANSFNNIWGRFAHTSGPHGDMVAADGEPTTVFLRSHFPARR